MAEGRLSELVFAREIMRSDVKTARPDSTVSEVVEKMNRFGIGSIIVVQERRPSIFSPSHECLVDAH